LQPIDFTLMENKNHPHFETAIPKTVDSRW
jgi:hypothetical protein